MKVHNTPVLVIVIQSVLQNISVVLSNFEIEAHVSGSRVYFTYWIESECTETKYHF